MNLAPETRDRIEDILRNHRIVLFMKGTRNAPRCGFSAGTAGILNGLVDDYASVDVLADPEIRAESNGIAILMDVATAQRARGIAIDWVDTVQGSGLSITNPNAPPTVQSLDVQGLKARIAAGDITVVDVRPAPDRQYAPFAGAEILDEDSIARLSALPKDRPLAFLCHHGNSSRGAAEHFRGLGFRQVFNVEGGIDAWSRQIDESVPRY